MEADLHDMLAAVDRGDLWQALKVGTVQLDLHPEDDRCRCLLGMIQGRLGRFPDAEACFQAILVRHPDAPFARYNLAKVLAITGRFADAIRDYRRAIALRPDFAEAYANLGNIYAQRRQWALAAQCLQQSLALRNDPGNRWVHLTRIETDYAHQVMSAYLFLQSYHVLSTPAESLAQHRLWEPMYLERYEIKRFPHLRRDDGTRRLRVGYVSPDFRQHSVSYFIEPILAHHDRASVAVYCYAELEGSDAVTLRLQGLSDVWRLTAGLSDAAVAQQIYRDGIDILVDLAGHTRGNRLGVFCYRPAPIQVTYLGYFSTTGLSTMDYWLSDAVLTPKETVEQSSERIWRTPGVSLCYRPPDSAPAVRPRPRVEGLPEERIMLGSFNDLSKVSSAALDLWSAVLRALPDARLTLKAKQVSDAGVIRELIDGFTQAGVSEDRLIFLAYTPDVQSHLALYGGIDLVLDTIPRTGGASTAEALWMGVPVVTLAGKRYIERLSATLLQSIGLGDCVCADRDSYIARVVAMAQDRVALTQLRMGLRQRMRQSDLCDGRRMASVLEDSYRHMWLDYLDDTGSCPLIPDAPS